MLLSTVTRCETNRRTQSTYVHLPDRYGPEAIRKLKEMFGYETKTWPAGKAVKVVFHQKDSANGPKTVMWKPEQMYFHEVIRNAESGIAIQDFDVSYKDKDGDKIMLEYTKLGIENFLAEHREHPSPRLEAGEGLAE